MSLLQVAISCQPISSLNQKERKVTIIKYKVIFWIYKTYFLRLICSLMQQAVCYVEIKKNVLRISNKKNSTISIYLLLLLHNNSQKKMKAPKSKALKHILNLTDKNCSSSQASTGMLCELRALDQSLT